MKDSVTELQTEMPQTKKANGTLRLILTVLLIALAVAGAAVALILLVFGNSAGRYVSRDDQGVYILSPGERTTLSLSVSNGSLQYSVKRDGRVFIEPSALGVTVDQTAYGELSSVEELGAVSAQLRTDVRQVRGRVREANGSCVSLSVPVGEGDGAFTLEARVYDDGVAFRYILPGEGKRTVKGEQTAFSLPTGAALWASDTHVYYESKVSRRDPSKPGTGTLSMPATVELSDGGYAAILEGNLADYAGMSLKWSDRYEYSASFEHGASGTFALSDEITTPWRIVAVADDLNELVNNTIVYQVCDEPDEGLYAGDWVKPGRVMWSWISGRNSSMVTPKIMKEYTNAAAELGFEYNLIDEGWVNWGSYEKTLKDLVAQGEPYGVGQLVWTGMTAGAGYNGTIDSLEDAQAYIDFLSAIGAAGGKMDFFTKETDVDMGVNIYRDILQYAAEKQIVLNFHGCNKPTGYDVTFPNELNREAILGFESTRANDRRTMAQMFTTQPFTRNLAGHADYTPAVNTAFLMAQLVLTDSPLQSIGTGPKTLLSLPSLEMIKSVPTVWEETVVLPQSEIGKAAVYARKAESGSWFVGGINYKASGETATLDLSLFLEDGTYHMELWTDGANGLEKEVRSVTKEDTVEVPFSELHGFIIRFDRVTLSQYGGKIGADGTVTVTAADPSTVIAYTLDGSEPGSGSAKVESGGTIALEDTCALRIKITGGAGEGGQYSCRFNKMN